MVVFWEKLGRLIKLGYVWSYDGTLFILSLGIFRHILNSKISHTNSWISFFLSTERSLDGDVSGVLSPLYQNLKNRRLHTCQPTHHKFSYLSPYSEICESFFLRSFWQPAIKYWTILYAKPWTNIGSETNERLKILFDFPENPDIIKLIIHLIILMIPFFKKNRTKFSYFPNWWPFWSSTFTFVLCHIHGKIWNISTPFLTQKHFFRQIKLMTTPMKGMVLYTGKAGSLIFVSCDVTHRDTGRPAENGRCVRAVWDNLKSRLLITDLSNNHPFGREGSLNKVSFDFIVQV